MIKSYLTTLLLLFFFSFKGISQDINLSSLLIPSNLKENANAVVRENITLITIKSIDELIVRRKRIVTILNKSGDREVDTYIHYNNDTKITDLSAKVYNVLGKEVKKYSKSKFKVSR